MKLELFILAVVGFLIYNTYTDGKCLNQLMSYKKYYKMLGYIIAAGIIYSMIKNPNNRNGKEMLYYANNWVRLMPFSKSLHPALLDFTNNRPSYMESYNNIQPSRQPLHTTSSTTTSNRQKKRSVSETKKKFVASNQGWKCGHCKSALDHTFEVDHRVRLEYGGGNDVSNLVALCRNCHGKKTAQENM